MNGVTDLGALMFRYCWRFAVRPTMWLIRVTLFIVAAAVISFAVQYSTLIGMATLVSIYGIYEIGRSIRSLQPVIVNIAKGENLVVQSGASVSVPKQDLDRVIEIIARRGVDL
jgi:hypothetical protein